MIVWGTVRVCVCVWNSLVCLLRRESVLFWTGIDCWRCVCGNQVGLKLVLVFLSVFRRLGRRWARCSGDCSGGPFVCFLGGSFEHVALRENWRMAMESGPRWRTMIALMALKRRRRISLEFEGTVSGFSENPVRVCKASGAVAEKHRAVSKELGPATGSLSVCFLSIQSSPLARP